MFRTKARGRSSSGGRGGRVTACALLVAYCLLFVVGCRQDMQDQPRYEVYEASNTFADGLSSRPYVEGTVARGNLRADKAYYTGKGGAGGSTSGGSQTSVPNVQGSAPGGATPSGNGGVGGNALSNNLKSGVTQPAGGADADINYFPFPITQEVLSRGEDRYKIFCSMCHGLTGFGDGMIVRRGYQRPPSYHDDRLREAPVGHFFDVITNGWGAMSDYSAQVPVQDRWAIIAYIRALQLSENAPAQDVPAEVRSKTTWSRDTTEEHRQSEVHQGNQEGGHAQ